LIDIFTLALTHSLIALALWRMLFRADLDVDETAEPPPPPPWRRRRQPEGTGRA
jgi:hypothetical protein